LIDRNSESSLWLCTAYLKPVTEALITAAQDQAICTNWMACHILGTANTDYAESVGQFPESIKYIVAGCPALAQNVYLNCHNDIISAVHWSLCGICGFVWSGEWWKHNPLGE